MVGSVDGSEVTEAPRARECDDVVTPGGSVVILVENMVSILADVGEEAS